MDSVREWEYVLCAFVCMKLRVYFRYFAQIVVPALPGKALSRQLPFRGDDGIFEEEFIEDRRKGLEQFINKWGIAAYECLVIAVT